LLPNGGEHEKARLSGGLSLPGFYWESRQTPEMQYDSGATDALQADAAVALMRRRRPKFYAFRMTGS